MGLVLIKDNKEIELDNIKKIINVFKNKDTPNIILILYITPIIFTKIIISQPHIPNFYEWLKIINIVYKLVDEHFKNIEPIKCHINLDILTNRTSAKYQLTIIFDDLELTLENYKYNINSGLLF